LAWYNGAESQWTRANSNDGSPSKARLSPIAHATKIDTIASALAALGMRLELNVIPA
jgi:hypothetical protein